MAISALPSVALPKYQYPLGVVKKNMRKFVELALESGVFFTTEGFGGRAKCDLVKEGSGGIVEELRMLSEKGRLKEALDLLHMMNQRDIKPDSNTYACLVQSCAAVKSVVMGKQVHLHMKKVGFEPDAVLQTKLVTMYSKCGNMENARQAFDEMPRKNVVTWTAMIAGYTQQRQGEKALLLFYEMQREGKKADQFTFASVLRACAGIRALAKGMQTHADIMKRGFESDLVLRSALVDMYAKCERIADARFVFEEMPERDIVSWNGLIAGYAKCGRMKDARQVFDEMPEKNVISWTAMIAGYTQNGHMEDALAVFYQMQFLGFRPDQLTYASLLRACAGLAALEQGKQIHAQVITSRLQSHFVLATALIDLYTKCGSIDAARHLFEKLPHRDAISWNAMIAGYVQNGYANDALKLFRQMELACVTVASATILSVLPACAHLAALQQGIEIHSYIIRRGFELDIFIGSALLDMYAKCGNLETARLLFDKMSRKDVVSWNAMISGYGLLGYGEDALTLFEQMQTIGMKPNDVTFTAILTACRHAGLVDEGWVYFNQMTQDYHISPRVEHYTAMVDLLGRVGRVNEAHDFIKKMPLEPDARVWGALLGACRNNCNIELGELVAEHLLKLEPEDAGYYVLLSNIYASAGRWDDVAKVRKMMTDRGLKKDPGYSWIEVNKRFHAFLGGDRSHPQSEKLYAMLENMAGQMKEAGYVPDTNFVLHDVEKEEKNYILCGHSEKLAIAFGLINTCPGTPIRITKNLRACGDCHNATKFISKITGREIIVRDANRFHHFKDGHCTCGDYW